MPASQTIWVDGAPYYRDIEGMLIPVPAGDIFYPDTTWFEGTLMGGQLNTPFPEPIGQMYVPNVNDALQIERTKQRQSFYLLIATVALFFVFRKK